MEWALREGIVQIQVIREDIIRCIYSKKEVLNKESLIIVPQNYPETAYEVDENAKQICIKTNALELKINRKNDIFSWYNLVNGKTYVQEAGKTLTQTNIIHYTTGDEAPVIERVKTVDGERNFIRNLKPIIDRTAYRGQLHFKWDDEEGIYGLGQGEEGIYNYRKHNQYLYQHNMRIPIPMFVSSNCYGVLFDCGSLMTFNDDENGSYVFMDAIDQMDYYFLAGQCIDDVVDGYRYLTGEAVMLPKWSFGYIQSKEAYHTQEELVNVVAKYRELEVPLDGIVQDWNTWKPGNWGEKVVDKSRFPDLREAMDKIHGMHVHTMVSVWPNMNPGGKNHKELFESGFLLHDYSTYNAFSEEARLMYWEQANEELFSGGFDSWWCDSTEPFCGPDWSGEVKREPWERYLLVGNEHKQYLDATKVNAYALMHAKGIYENQRNTTDKKRVLNLTRSGYAASQRYGTMLWSGDTCATWEKFRIQIIEGLNFTISGMPYWTLDIGAFFVVGKEWKNRGCNCNENPNPLWFWQGNYDEGVKDNAYKELYVRWFEYGTFLPMFRSHGTDTPREIWNFGKKGEMFYDAIEKFIHLRYHLMPYIYSLAGAVKRHNSTIMRSLLFDFMKDRTARNITDEFMFGTAILVCCVTEPLYYDIGGQSLTKEKKKLCYLPEGVIWHNYWTSEQYLGGQWIEASATIDQIPLFIKAGSIIPSMNGLHYADEIPQHPVTLNIYGGADGIFELYEDEGDNYNYEAGAYTVIPIRWKDETKQLIIERREGSYVGMEEVRTFLIHDNINTKKITYNGEQTVVQM